MKYNPLHKSLGKPLTNIIGVMQNIELTISPDRNTTIPEKLEANIEQMDHELPTTFS